MTDKSFSSEDDLGAVGREVGVSIVSLLVSKPSLVRTIGVHYVDLVVAGPGTNESDFGAIGREGWLLILSGGEGKPSLV
jgi:hypothetical protein